MDRAVVDLPAGKPNARDRRRECESQAVREKKFREDLFYRLFVERLDGFRQTILFNWLSSLAGNDCDQVYY